MKGYVKVASRGDVPGDKGLPVKIGKREAALFRVDGKYYAIKDVCPHLGAALHRGFILGGRTLACPDHGWTFDLESGACTNRPGCSVPCYDVQLVGEEIYVSERYRRSGAPSCSPPSVGEGTT
ncbi:MAG: Rieske (2Fe-2S) protein [Planctomycetes bacterium]|nr:Rieske (2Fe-2S) protein [Planctomycetota bacterium]